jgi:hypothetical protein
MDMYTPHMPEVDPREDIETIFARVRSTAEEPHQGTDGIYRRQVVILTPGRLIIGKDCPLARDLLKEEIKILENLVPQKPAIQIAVIAYTFLNALKADMRKAIPFIDYLLGFAALGHSVWVFEGHHSALSAGCRDADLLLVDNGMLPSLEDIPNWRANAEAVMRTPNIKLISREKLQSS